MIFRQKQYPWTNGKGSQTVVPDSASGGASTSMSSGSASTMITATGGSAGSSTSSSSSSTSQATLSSTPDFGAQKPDATPGDALGSGAASLTASGGLVHVLFDCSFGVV